MQNLYMDMLSPAHRFGEVTIGLRHVDRSRSPIGWNRLLWCY